MLAEEVATFLRELLSQTDSEGLSLVRRIIKLIRETAPGSLLHPLYAASSLASAAHDATFPRLYPHPKCAGRCSVDAGLPHCVHLVCRWHCWRCDDARGY